MYWISEFLYSLRVLVHLKLTLDGFFEHCCWIDCDDCTMTKVLINQKLKWSHHLCVFWLFSTLQMNNPVEHELVNYCLQNWFKCLTTNWLLCLLYYQIIGPNWLGCSLWNDCLSIDTISYLSVTIKLYPMASHCKYYISVKQQFSYQHWNNANITKRNNLFIHWSVLQLTALDNGKWVDNLYRLNVERNISRSHCANQ